MKRSQKISLAVLGLFVAAVVAGVALVDVDALVEAKKPALLKQASDAVGREVSIGEIDARLLPSFGATLSRVTVAGRSADAPPLLAVGSAELRFSLWKAITSFGKDLEVKALELRDVKATVARAKDGSWSFEDILERQAEAPKSDEPADLSFLEGASVERAAILGAEIVFDDAQLGRPLKAEGLSLVLTDVRLGAPLTAKLEATLVDGAKKTPLALDVKMRELPKSLSFEPFPELVAALRLGELDVAPWGALLPADALAPAGGTLSADVSLDAGRDLTSFKSSGTLKASALVLAQAKKRGQPLDADVAFDVDVDTAAPRYLVRSLRATGTGLDISGSVDASTASLAGIKTADVKARVANPQRVLAVLPPGSAALPPELKLEGPITAALTGNADAVDLSVNLDGARVAWADSFDKAPGRPLNLTMKGKRAGEVLLVEPFALVVDTARIGGKLGLPTNDKAPLTADIQSGPITLASLKSVVPPFAEALGKGKKVDGTLAVKATAKSDNGRQDARVSVTFDALDVNLAKASARGAAKVDAVLAPKEGVLDVSTVADLSGLELKSVNASGETVLDKPAGMPARLEVSVSKTDQRADVRQALLAVGDTKLSAKGEATGLDGARPQLNLDFGSVDVAFNDLRRALPGASDLPAGGRLRGQLKVTGSPEALATLELAASALDLSFGSTSLKGNLRVVNLDEPRIETDLSSLKLAFDDVNALTQSNTLPAGGRYEGALKLSVDTANTSTLKADLQANRLSVGKSDLRGTAALANLDRPNFSFDLTGNSVDVDQLFAAFGADSDESASQAQQPDENPHGLSKGSREKLKKTNGRGTIKAASVVYRGIPMQEFVGSLTVKNGVAVFDALDFKLYGGKVSAKGTQLDLPAEYTGYGLKLKVDRMDLGKALAAHTDLGGVFRGEVSQNIDLSGRGLTKEDLIKTLQGPTVLRTDSLTVASLDLLTPILGILESASKTMPGTPKIAGKATRGTDLRDVEAFLRFLGGKMELEKPITSQTPFGAVTFTGQAFLDSRLDLEALVKLSPQTISQWTSGKVKPASAVEVPMKIGGTWKQPAITGIDAKKLVESVLGLALAGALGGVGGDAVKQAGEVVSKAKDVIEGGRKQAEAKADDAKKRAEAEANKRADEAKKKADDAKKKAEAEAKKKADDAKKKAEAEAKKKAEDAKKKAADEAKKRLGF